MVSGFFDSGFRVQGLGLRVSSWLWLGLRDVKGYYMWMYRAFWLYGCCSKSGESNGTESSNLLDLIQGIVENQMAHSLLLFSVFICGPHIYRVQGHYANNRHNRGSRSERK